MPAEMSLLPGPSPARREAIAYNVIEAIVAITAGTIASSTALIGFGLAWACRRVRLRPFRKRRPDGDEGIPP